ncbi:acyl-coenzyme A thioesterase [Rhodotorula diobovata]|uniref:Acyl-coenzyme A thioesterase n=1 Tax=Rhodotorula diobovata TaxID=5288 RepID=A0A5C5FPD5_9BASI|nr:acyl-coenzyme A thioesterase [Rhodotorula diobovata]
MPAATTADPRVLDLVRARLERSLNFDYGGFAADQAKLISLGDVVLDGVHLDGDDDTKPSRGATATVTCHLTVSESCCNPSGNAHGGFLAWLVDHCSSLVLLALSGPGDKWLTSGVSTQLQLFYVGAAPIGNKLRIVNTVLQHGRVTGLLETRIEDEETGKLLVHATHTKQDPQRRPTINNKL